MVIYSGEKGIVFTYRGAVMWKKLLLLLHLAFVNQVAYSDQNALYQKFMQQLSQDKVVKNKFIRHNPRQQIQLNNDVGYFISFSMPDLAIQEALRQAQKYHVPVYINGLINDSFADTAQKFIQHFGQNSSYGLGIDPIRFTRFNVNTVPTLVLKCGQQIDKLTGNIPLKNAIEKMATEGDCATDAKKLLGTAL